MTICLYHFFSLSLSIIQTFWVPWFISTVSTIWCCFQRSEMALEVTHLIFQPLNNLLPTTTCANYSQINNVPNLFGIISGSCCLPLCSDKRGKAISTPVQAPSSNYISNYLSQPLSFCLAALFRSFGELVWGKHDVKCNINGNLTKARANEISEMDAACLVIEGRWCECIFGHLVGLLHHA